jgi:hypothetical protein
VPQAQSAKAATAISPTRAEDFAGWYQEVVREAELATMAHVRGCMVIRPWGYRMWELMQAELDLQIRARRHANVYFPLFIPVSYLQAEAEHVEGFAKEMAVVTHHRLESVDGVLTPAGPLEEPVVVRPTSETIFGKSMAEWIQSYRDLPMRLNQWCNIVRWEMRPRVFLRTTEFLWQEGHTAHESEASAMADTLNAHEMYQTFAEDFLCIPTVPGEKSESERFPGAVKTFTIEAMMQDGRALQAGTSHYLGQNFARAVGIDFLDRDNRREHVYTTSFGISTRLIGAVIMTHGDDDGLVLPPKIAPAQVVIVPILRGVGQRGHPGLRRGSGDRAGPARRPGPGPGPGGANGAPGQRCPVELHQEGRSGHHRGRAAGCGQPHRQLPGQARPPQRPLGPLRRGGGGDDERARRSALRAADPGADPAAGRHPLGPVQLRGPAEVLRRRPRPGAGPLVR